MHANCAHLSPQGSKRDTLVLGTRGSQLARAQTQGVADHIRTYHRELEIRIEVITTTGDRRQHQPLPEIGSKGIFTQELEQALLGGSIDLAVHSAKDLPTAIRDELDIVAVPQRENPRDAWISADGTAFDDLPPGSVVGTTSLRRQAQLLMRGRHLSFVGLRGNVDTRLEKIRRGDCAGAVLAMAGLNRLGLAACVTHPFEPEAMLPAPGQGTLALQGRRDDQRVREYVQSLHHEPTGVALEVERAILHELDAGCRAPVAIFAEVNGRQVRCRALVADPQGKRCVRASGDGPVDEASALADRVVAGLRAQGADEIIAACRRATG